MALTRRGRVALIVLAILVVMGAVVGAAIVTRPEGGSIVDAVTDLVQPNPECPLTGLPASDGDAPARPVLAVKIENSPPARPQAGLNDAEIVYEEPVEGGITRFIALYQCADVDRLGPVRSARTTDPDVLTQFGVPVFAYSGGAPLVGQRVREAGLLDVNFEEHPDLYDRDPAREMPHDVFTSSSRLWAGATWPAELPDGVFVFDEDLPEISRPAGTVNLDFSPSSDVWWRWDAGLGLWLRWHGDYPHLLEDGSQVGATTVVVQVVEVVPGTIVDAAGNPSPEVSLLGGGKAYVFRDGRVVVGTWVRDSLGEVTRFLTKEGEEIALPPGRTWVELFPSTVEVVFTKA